MWFLANVLILVSLCGGSPAQEAFEAIENGDDQLLGSLLQVNPALVRSTNANHRTLLHVAVSASNVTGRLDMVARLIEANSDLNTIDVNGECILFTAMNARNTSAVRLLRMAGAREDIWCSLIRDNTAQMVKQIQHDRSWVTSEISGQSPLLLAAKHNCGGGVLVLLRHRAVIDAVCGNGDTALIAAVRNRSFLAMTLLLARGADPYVRTPDGISALDVAVAGGSLDLFQPLLMHVPEASRTEAQIRSLAFALTLSDSSRARQVAAIPCHGLLQQALIYAARVGDQRLLQFALHMGVPADLTMSNGKSVLLVACEAEQFGIARQLICAGAKVRSAEAAYSDRVEIDRELLHTQPSR